MTSISPGSRSGVNQWRDQMKPSQILDNVARLKGLSKPRTEDNGNTLTFQGRDYTLAEFGKAQSSDLFCAMFYPEFNQSCNFNFIIQELMIQVAKTFRIKCCNELHSIEALFPKKCNDFTTLKTVCRILPIQRPTRRSTNTWARPASACVCTCSEPRGWSRSTWRPGPCTAASSPRSPRFARPHIQTPPPSLAKALLNMCIAGMNHVKQVNQYAVIICIYYSY